MTEHIVSHSTHILRHHIATTLDESVGTGSLGQIDAGTGRTTEGNHILQFRQRIAIRITGGKDDIGNILLDLLVEIDLAHHAASPQDGIGCGDGRYLRHFAGDVLTDNLLLLVE